MKRISLVLSTSMLLSACGGSDDASEPPVDPFDEVRAAAIEQLERSIAPAVSIGIYKSGEVVFAEAFGSKIDGEAEPVDNETLFQIGSTTKMLTVLAALREVEANAFTLEDKLVGLYPGMQLPASMQADWQDINVQHLMTHQSGMRDFVGWDEELGSTQEVFQTLYPQQYGLMNGPGKFWNYSNPNWSYLGAILEHQLDDNFPNIIERSVFDALDMQRSTVRQVDVANDGNYALGAGIIRGGDGFIEGSAKHLDDVPNSIYGLAAGSYTWSTPTEMLKVAEFLMQGDTAILSDELRQQMTTPQVDLREGFPIDYGYGILIRQGIQAGNDQWLPMPIWEHGGNTLNYTSIFWVFPEAEAAVVILSSGYQTDFSNVLVEALKTVVTLPEPQAFPIEPVATELFENHVGRYVATLELSDEGGVQELVMDVSLEDGTLLVDIPLFNANNVEYSRVLTPLRGSIFEINAVGDTLQVAFIAEEEGGQSMYLRNRSFVGIRDDNASVENTNQDRQRQQKTTTFKLQSDLVL